MFTLKSLPWFISVFAAIAVGVTIGYNLPVSCPVTKAQKREAYNQGAIDFFFNRAYDPTPFVGDEVLLLWYADGAKAAVKCLDELRPKP